MGIYDRDYARAEGGRWETPMGGLGGLSVTAWLAIANVAVFVLDLVLGGVFGPGAAGRGLGGPLTRWGCLVLPDAASGLELWRWVTYQFLHAGVMHLVLNVVGLMMFGPLVESWWGRWRYLWFYLLCGCAGGLVFAGLGWTPLLGSGVWSGRVHVVGASGSIFGVLAATAVLAPERRVLFLMVVPMSMRTLALVLIGFGVLVVVTRGNNAGGEAAHLGGAALGALLTWCPGLLGRGMAWGGRSAARGGRPGEGARMAATTRVFVEQLSQEQVKRQADEAEVDRILEKVRREGIQSLTEAEKRRLSAETERLRGSE